MDVARSDVLDALLQVPPRKRRRCDKQRPLTGTRRAVRRSADSTRRDTAANTCASVHPAPAARVVGEDGGTGLRSVIGASASTRLSQRSFQKIRQPAWQPPWLSPPQREVPEVNGVLHAPRLHAARRVCRSCAPFSGPGIAARKHGTSRGMNGSISSRPLVVQRRQDVFPAPNLNPLTRVQLQAIAHSHTSPRVARGPPVSSYAPSSRPADAIRRCRTSFSSGKSSHAAAARPWRCGD